MKAASNPSFHIGESFQRRVLVVVHTDRGDSIRLISARVATPQERKRYEKDPIG